MNNNNNRQVTSELINQLTGSNTKTKSQVKQVDAQTILRLSRI